MSTQLMLLNEFLPATSLPIGALVESLLDPIADAYTPSRLLPEDAILPLPVKSFSSLLSNTSDTTFKVALTRLLENSYKNANAEETSMESVLVKRYKLKQPRELFSELCFEDTKARRWLEGGIKAGRKSYLVVELQTAVDATIRRKDSHAFGAEGKVVVPVSTIATGGIDVLGLGAALDSEIGAGLVKTNSLEKSFTIEGENIFAVGYKRIVWKGWGLKKKLEKATLDDKITWSIMGQRRGREDQEEVISVDLTDDFKQKEDKDEEEDDDDDDDEDDEEEAVRQADVDGETYMYADSTER